ncbi:MAG: bifunctional phosphoglucose/phosphomannose isomerase [Peptococcaceae bacterium]|nr:MAG: bifunctional phosphoglucose/phosphomannose isomerase [Peptococcaceae bacterium]
MEVLAFNLNNAKAIYRLDSSGMMTALGGLAGQCVDACWNLTAGIEPPPVEAVSHIVVTGLGGSAIGGDLLRVYCHDKIPVPVTVNRHYTLPSFVGRDTLVFAVSYSGNTEETLSAYEDARRRESAIVVITSGGKLKEMALRDGVTLITIPGGVAPRAATGFLFIPTLRVMEKLGFLPGMEGSIAAMIDHLRELWEKLKPETPVTENLAKQLAQKLFNRIPVIWGTSGSTEVVAQRWKGQINENTKAPAYWNMFPELNHNEIVGFQVPGELLKKLHVVMLRDDEDHPRVQKRIDITREIIKDRVGGISEVHASGEGDLSRLYSLIYLGDCTSVYLAALYGIDPGPVKVIEQLKQELENCGPVCGLP